MIIKLQESPSHWSKSHSLGYVIRELSHCFENTRVPRQGPAIRALADQVGGGTRCAMANLSKRPIVRVASEVLASFS